tara:strand:- start:171 stop:551 length:381 start_codon:yes stop_codon:yes gene_type:complete
MNISPKTREVCISALEAALENSAEYLKNSIVGADVYDMEYLHEIIADGPTEEISEDDIEDIREYTDRHQAILELGISDESGVLAMIPDHLLHPIGSDEIWECFMNILEYASRDEGNHFHGYVVSKF